MGTSAQEPDRDTAPGSQFAEPEPGRSMGRAVAAVLVVAIVVIGVISFFFLQRTIHDRPEYTESFSWEEPIDPAWTLTVTTTNGYIRIVGWDEDVVNVSGVKRARTQEDLEALDLSVIIGGFNMEIRTVYTTGDFNDQRIDLDIRVPRNITIQRLESTNGEINVRDMSVIHEIETTNGAISSEIAETDGDVDLSSVNGRIDCYLPDTLNATVDLSTVNGQIDTGDVALVLTINEPKHKRGNLGNGGDLISISTTNGDIVLHRLM